MKKFLLLATVMLLDLPCVMAGPTPFSTSIMRPTPIDSSGVISGAFPATKATYYFFIDAQSGDLLTQLSFRGTKGAQKSLQLELLDGSARVKDSYWIHGEDASSESTRSFPLDNAGKKILRVATQGPETGRFCVLVGGAAFPTTGDQECWPTEETHASAPRQEASTTTDLRRAHIEVVESKCEQRLRIGSDVLFDFDKAETRSDAAPTLDAAAQYLQSSTHAVRVEGHTDGKGADAYNQTLSEKRAESVRQYFARHGVAPSRVSSVGFGETKPVAPNTQTDGADDPEGRQKNRRVEIVIDTCA